MTISRDDPRSIKAIQIASGAGRWLKCRTRTDGRKVYGVPSQSTPGVYHLADQQSCTCQDAQHHPSQACKHVLAVRLHVELMKAQQPKPTKTTGSILRMVRHEDGELSWERDTHPSIA